MSIVWLLAPQLECAAAVLSPSTGIIDSHALMLSLQGDFKNAGGLVVLNSTLAGVFIASAAIKIIVFGSDVEWVKSADDLAVNPTRDDAFYAEIHKYWPAPQDGALTAGYAGQSIAK